MGMEMRTVSRRRGYHWRDETADFQREGSTMPLKNAQYYKRSWTAGQPFSGMPIWSAVEHVPVNRLHMVVRPDLGLAALHRVLDHVVREKEAVLEAARRIQAEQVAERQTMARRHMKRQEGHLACGGCSSPQHAYADLITAVSPTTPEPVPVEDLGGDTSQSTLAYLRRQHELLHAQPPEADVAELSPFGTHASDLRKPPMAACYEGVAGLVIPRHAVVEKVEVPVLVPMPRRSSSTPSLRSRQPALRCLPPEFRDYSGRFDAARPGSRIWARDPLSGVPSLSTSRPVSRATRPASRGLASQSLRKPRLQPLLPTSDGTQPTCDSPSGFYLPSAPTADATVPPPNLATFPPAALGLPPADADDDDEDPAARDTPPVSPREGALVAARTKQASAKEAARHAELDKQQQDDKADAKLARQAKLLRQRAATREVNKRLRQVAPGEMYGSINQGIWSRNQPGEKDRLVTKRRIHAGPGQRGFWKEARDIISEGSMVAADLEAEGRGPGWERGSRTGLPVELLGEQKSEMSRLRRRRHTSDSCLPGQLLARGMLKDGQVLSAFEGLVRDDSTRALRSGRSGIARPAPRGGASTRQAGLQ